MACKDCKIVCDGKEVAVVTCSKDGVTIRCTEAGKEFCKQFAGCC